jgi:hypothetical protein
LASPDFSPDFGLILRRFLAPAFGPTRPRIGATWTKPGGCSRINEIGAQPGQVEFRVSAGVQKVHWDRAASPRTRRFFSQSTQLPSPNPSASSEPGAGSGTGVGGRAVKTQALPKPQDEIAWTCAAA